MSEPGSESGSDLAAAPPSVPKPSRGRPLRLSDPWQGDAAEDRPESWGERSPTDAERWAEYEAQRPPHHGS